jgi:hypothetical protein
METRRGWSEQDFKTAQGLWRRGAEMGDDDRRALERAAVRYFFKACGMDREKIGDDREVGSCRSSPAEGGDPRLTRLAGGELPGADGN